MTLRGTSLISIKFGGGGVERLWFVVNVVEVVDDSVAAAVAVLDDVVVGVELSSTSLGILLVVNKLL